MNSTEKWIAKKAEEKYSDISDWNVMNIAPTQRAAYSAGAKDMKEHLGGFVEWLVQRKVQPIGKNFWEDWGQNDDEAQTVPVLTTDQLIEKYFKQLLNKQ